MRDAILPPDQLKNLFSGHPPLEFNAPATESPLATILMAQGREKLKGALEERHCQPGEVVFWEDDPADDVYFILSGRAAIVKGNIAITPTVLGYREAGDIVGEMSLIEDAPRSASFIALTDLRLLRLRRDQFRAMLRRETELGMGLLTLLSHRLREAGVFRQSDAVVEQALENKLVEVHTEHTQLLETQRLRQETMDFIVHDLRNPLATVISGLSLMEVTFPAEILANNQEMLDIMRYGCERLQRLIDSLLTLTRMEAGEEKFSFEPIPATELAASLSKRIIPLLNSRHLHPVFNAPPTLPTVNADVEKIERVILNLIDNAIKHSSPEQPVTMEAHSVENNFVKFSVANLGRVIPADDRERIFERFAQMTSTDRRRGFGLGLAFCRQIVQAHGGRIWVEPLPDNKGNRFCFTLSVAQSN